jgi:hypothetical protein
MRLVRKEYIMTYSGVWEQNRYYGKGFINSVLKQVKELDEQISNFKINNSLTDDNCKKYLEEAYQMAKETGNTTSTCLYIISDRIKNKIEE